MGLPVLSRRRIQPREIYFNTQDRSDFIEGPWTKETVDKVVWVDAETNLDCMVVRNHSGIWCGYVGVPPGHPYHGAPNGTVPVDVHGGLTYAAGCQEDAPRATGICHIAQSGRPDPVWWLGFDCGHGWDINPRVVTLEREEGFPDLTLPGATYKDLAYVVGEVESLAQQLASCKSHLARRGLARGGR